MSDYRKLILPWLLVVISLTIMLVSCRTVKYVDRVEIRHDSTSVRLLDSIQRVKTEDSISYTKQIEALSDNQVIFQDTGSVRIEYRPDGSLQAVEGKVKSLNSKLLFSQLENSTWEHRYDSVSRIKRHDSTIVKTDYKEKLINKKVTVFPWYFWFALLFALIVGWRFGKIHFKL